MTIIRFDDGRDDGFVTKDSGKRQDYPSGMRRDTQEGKPRYDLVDKAFLRRVADLMGRGVEKYGERNWELADSLEEYVRFRSSANRHLEDWMIVELAWEKSFLDPDYVPTELEATLALEDHAAAVYFNMAAAAHVKNKLKKI